MTQPVRFYGLLFVSDLAERHANLKPGADPIDIYLRCAVNCARSFEHFGHSFRIVTNAAPHLARRAQALGLGTVPLEPLEFAMEVSVDVGFASAHRKLEVIAAFGTGRFGERVGLVDLDTELVRPFPASLDSDLAFRALDLSELHRREHGDATIRAVQETVLDEPVIEPSWWGGEFLIGSAEQFATLSQTIFACLQHYVENVHGFFHQGDEVLTSAAIGKHRAAGLPVRDAGGEGLVARWWSARTLSRMPRFSAVSGAALMHLPADKLFLAARAGTRPDPARFVEEYSRHLRRGLFARAIMSLAERITRKTPRKYAARL